MKNHKSPRKPASEHDRLAQRLTDLLYRLNLGEALDLDALAEEYRVHPRTIRRDLTERFAFFPIEKKQGRYVLDPSYLGRLRYQDIEKFAALAGVKGLFPSLDSPFFRELLDSRLQDTLSVHSPNYEDLPVVA
jgi:predicted DNA-binding transcriptional regulator YafY